MVFPEIKLAPFDTVYDEEWPFQIAYSTEVKAERLSRAFWCEQLAQEVETLENYMSDCDPLTPRAFKMLYEKAKALRAELLAQAKKDKGE